jgi:sugar (pentulose or hexulose) kinase
MLAAVTGLPLDCAGSDASSLLGAAIIARGLCEPATPLATLTAEMTPGASHIEPAANASSLYETIYEQYVRSLTPATSAALPRDCCRQVNPL